MTQINQNYVNELIAALEEQRNQALADSARNRAEAKTLATQLAAIAGVIKEHSLEKFFDGSMRAQKDQESEAASSE